MLKLIELTKKNKNQVAGCRDDATIATPTTGHRSHTMAIKLQCHMVPFEVIESKSVCL
jgi:hypothetical protein